MSDYLMHQGINFQGGGQLKNGRVEQLASDPVANLFEGRFFENITDKEFKIILNGVIRKILTNGDIAIGTDISGAVAGKILDAASVLDEDNFASNSDQHVATQQSIKAYVDAKIAGGIIYRGTLSGSANLTGTSTGNVYIDAGNGYVKGDLFVISSDGTLTTSTGTNIEVVAGEEMFILNDVATNAAITDADVEKISIDSKVLSVFGRVGVVTAQSGDYTASQVTNVASGNVSAITVQAAIDELDDDKASNTLLGVGVDAVDMGTYTGTILADNQTVKVNIQELETALQAEQSFKAAAQSFTASIAKNITHNLISVDVQVLYRLNGSNNSYSVAGATVVDANTVQVTLLTTGSFDIIVKPH